MLNLDLIKLSVWAASSDNVTDLGQALQGAPGGGASLGSLIPSFYALVIIAGALGVFILLLYAGFDWLTAGGDSEKVKTAQKKVTNAIIGLVLVLFAWGLWRLVLGFTGLKDKLPITRKSPVVNFPTGAPPPNPPITGAAGDIP